jgi:hypothetical protein
VEQGLRTLRANVGGRLPILDGFVASEEPLDRYQRPFYQYSVQITAADAHSCIVRVSARITAWYADPIPSQARYRVLSSNGRLEADLLDRLNEALGAKTDASAVPPPVAAAPAKDTTSMTAPSTSGAAIQAARPALTLPRPGVPDLSQRSQTHSGVSVADDTHIRQLSEEAKNLEQILRNQSRPEDLVSVKSAHASVLDRPADDAKVLFLADAEDEFQIMEVKDEWVHVQISGLSRGWIHRSELQLPAAYDNSAPVTAAQAATAAPFRQTHQETGAFPGSWEPLRGKQVKVVWVQPSSNEAAQSDKFSYAKSVFRKMFPELLRANPPLAGVVVVFDSEDGGMAAVTLATLQQWNAHHMTDNTLWKQCWFDPADAFKLKD